MRFKIKEWERVCDDVHNYEDVYNNIGIKEFTMTQSMGGGMQGMLDDQFVNSIFNIKFTENFIEIHGFIHDDKNEIKFVIYRLYKVGYPDEKN